MAASQPRRALFHWEQLAAGAFPAARFPRAPSQSRDSPMSPLPRRVAAVPRACLGSWWCRRVPRASRAAGTAGLLLCQRHHSRLSQPGSHPQAVWKVPELQCPAQAAAGRSWFAPGAGGAAAAASPWHMRAELCRGWMNSPVQLLWLLCGSFAVLDLQQQGRGGRGWLQGGFFGWAWEKGDVTWVRFAAWRGYDAASPSLVSFFSSPFPR